MGASQSTVEDLRTRQEKIDEKLVRVREQGAELLQRRAELERAQAELGTNQQEAIRRMESLKQMVAAKSEQAERRGRLRALIEQNNALTRELNGSRYDEVRALTPEQRRLYHEWCRRHSEDDALTRSEAENELIESSFPSRHVIPLCDIYFEKQAEVVRLQGEITQLKQQDNDN
eukprot:CAMPEP_0174238894 /NCGR_PEP_ID=MMETSP0417-20130205/12897_1 /TAXON_ID=242541 /ORGANISM="Mayorella sp, Strain BSH-02190019" /LENGTH=173 /DNA_ID=CAMNT_0015317783 /DNA_START=33 /DNA_END=551 /DNA_ORIENTATION=+